MKSGVILSILLLSSIFIFPPNKIDGQIPNSQLLLGIRGSKISGNLGGSVFGIGDINNDGYDDVYVSSSKNILTNPGYIVFGRDTFGSITNGTSISQIADITINTVVIDVENLGDINGDGKPDLAISVSNYGDKTYIYFGRDVWPSDLNILDADMRIVGYNMRVGLHIRALGDINKDGFADFAYSVQDNNGIGKINVLYGREIWPEYINELSKVNATFNGIDGGFLFGTTFENLNDINGDGLVDIAITSIYNYNSNVSIFLGKASGWYGNYSYTDCDISIQTSNYDTVIKPLGDVNNDGISDFGTYTTSTSSSTVFSIWFGRSTWVSSYTEFGYSAKISTVYPDYLSYIEIIGGTDLNNDGIDDIQLVAKERNFNLRVIKGRKTWDFDNPIKDESSFDFTREYNPWMSDWKLVGDLDGDGQNDIAYGNSANDYDHKGDMGLFMILLNPNIRDSPAPKEYPTYYIPQSPSISYASSFNTPLDTYVEQLYITPTEIGVSQHYYQDIYVFNHKGTFKNKLSGHINQPVIMAQMGNVSISRDLVGKMVYWNTTQNLQNIGEYYVPVSSTWDGITIAANEEKNWLAFNGRDMNISVVDADTKKMVFNWISNNPDGEMRDLALNNRNVAILSQPTDYISSLLVFDVITGKVLYNETSAREFTQIEYLSDGRLIASTAYGSIYMIHLNTTYCNLDLIANEINSLGDMKANPKLPIVAFNSGYYTNILVPDTGEIFKINLEISSGPSWNADGKLLGLPFYNSSNYAAAFYKIQHDAVPMRPVEGPKDTNFTNTTSTSTEEKTSVSSAQNTTNNKNENTKFHLVTNLQLYLIGVFTLLVLLRRKYKYTK